VLTAMAVLGFFRLRRQRIGRPSALLGASLESGMNPSTETTPTGAASAARFGPQNLMAEHTSIPAGHPSGSMLVVSDPGDLSR
jgi:hypothetical protein